MKRAIVLAGGGSRGGYQMGVWKALRELSLDYQIVTGTSVGALNGAMMVQGDYDAAVEMWEHLTNKDVIKLDGVEVADNPLECDREERRRILRAFMNDMMQKGGADVTPLEELVRFYLREEKLRKSPVDFGLITVEYPSMKELKLTKEQIPYGRIADFLLASAACFPAFRAREIEGVRYIDGGYYDNIPIDLAVSMGADEVVAVDLDGIGFKRSKISGREVPVTYIRSHWNLGNILLFEQDTTRRNMQLGYNDAMKAFGYYEGMAYTFEKGEIIPNARRLQEAYDAQIQLFSQGASDKKRNPLMLGIAYRAVVEEVRKLRGLDRDMTMPEMVTACGEICAELLGLDPTKVYSFDRMNREIMLTYHQLAAEAVRTVEEVTRNELNIREVIKLIHSLDRRHVACYIAERLESLLSAENGERDAALLAVAFPKASASAFYINLLLYDEERQSITL